MPTPSTDGPELLATPGELRRWSVARRMAGETVGMVPTMGALHAGHRALIDRAVAENDSVVVTIFVNPAQFGPTEDFSRYPRNLDADVAVLASAGVHAAFMPSVDVMYPAGLVTRLHVVGPLGDRLEGASRPGHFDGVALVVAKLLVAGLPDPPISGRRTRSSAPSSGTWPRTSTPASKSLSAQRFAMSTGWPSPAAMRI